MKALLIKDLRLVKGQARSMMVGLIMALMVFGMWKPTYVSGYGSVLGGLVAMSTLSYDEYQNGLSFLLALPVQRKTYVREKYLLLLILSAIYCFVPVGLMELIRPGDPANWEDAFGDRFMSYIIAWLILTLFSAVMIPLQLKFGAEKSRIVLYGLVGVVAALCYIVTSKIDTFQIYSSMKRIKNILEMLGVAGSMAVGGIIIAALFLGMMWISTRIMLKKEF